MNENLNRRDFTKRTSMTVGGILTGALPGNRRSIGQEHEMSDKRLLMLGLNALARAHRFDYFADGHRGAGMVSAHFLCVDNDLDKQATSRIVELVDINWASSALCKPFPEAKSEPERIPLESQRGRAQADVGWRGCHPDRVQVTVRSQL